MTATYMEIPDPVAILQRDLRAAASTLTQTEARYLVDAYYQIQDYRMAAAGQGRAMDSSGEPHAIHTWYFSQMETIEKEIAKGLGKYADAHVASQWAQTIVGIGPVLSAGLQAHIEIARAPTVGHIWRFAGLDPTTKWEKGQKRPWSAALKVLCWKIGESFVKVSGNERDIYGHVYAERKALEIERNEAGMFSEQAARVLEGKRIGKDTDAHKAYSAGKLPPAHIHARAKRYATKLFLSHYHHVAYEVEYGTPPPKPYIIEHGGHTHFIAAPHWPMES